MEALSVGHNVEDFGSKRKKKVWKLARKEESSALFCERMCLVHIPTQHLPSAFPHPLPQFPPLSFQSQVCFNLRGYMWLHMRST